MSKDSVAQQDFFARVAAAHALPRDALLVEPAPPRRPRIYLPADQSSSAAAFHPTPRLNSAQKLQAELARQRRRHARFLANLAPALASIRNTVLLEEFDWRLQTDADRRDFIGTLNGAGAWQRVRLPHYGGPIGRAVAFYRTTFQVTEAMRRPGALFLCFQGVDYKAHVFVNGSYLGSHEGFFAPFEFEFTGVARIGKNTLLVKVENDAVPLGNDGWGQKQAGDKLYAATGLGWDDPELGWHHCPPGMGIYQKVAVEARPPVHIRDVFVRPLLTEKRAEAWIELFNCTRESRQVTFTISLFGRNFAHTVFRDRAFDPPQELGPGVNCFRLPFDVPNPRVWNLETPWLYQVHIALPNGDTLARQFGMRSFHMDTQHKPYGRLFLNGREIRLRGANTMGFEQQDVLRKDFHQLRDDILLAKICHLNFWRLTQRPVQTEVYDLCDQLGLLTQTDLPLFGRLPRRQWTEAVRQAEEMERLVRGHACNIMVSFINEPSNTAGGDDSPRHCRRAELEQFFTAAGCAVHLANPDRVIKPADGDYDPPGPGLPDNHCYTCWYNGHGVDAGKLHRGYWQKVKPDWFYACGEFGAEGLDAVDLMRQYYPQPWLPRSPREEARWSPNRIPRAQTGNFHFLFFETPRTLEGWVAASQRHQAWATRLMTEAFRRDNRLNSLAIHLFIDAFPAGWMKAIMDCQRRPKPAFFAYREALTPLMANLRTDRTAFFSGEKMLFEVWICNDTHEIPRGASLRYQLETGGRVVFAQQAPARVEKCQSTFQGFLRLVAPPVPTRTQAVLRLALASGGGGVLHHTTLELDLFPLPARSLPPSVAVIGSPRGKAAALARQLACPRGVSSTIFLVDDFAAFTSRRRELEAAVERGAVLVFLELPEGEYEIGSTQVKIVPCGMGARHFVARNTGHPLVCDLQPEDFKFWYDPALDRVSPLLETTFTAPGWTPILTSGNGRWGGTAWEPTLAAAELQRGSGRYRLCQVRLAGRVNANPVARIFAERLLRMDVLQRGEGGG